MPTAQISPPRNDTDYEDTEAGVLEDARKRQRRHRRIGSALLLSAVAVAALTYGLANGGGGAGRNGGGTAKAAGGPKGASLLRELRADARGLYAPVAAYEHSTTAAERTRSRTAARHLAKTINACDAPFFKAVGLSSATNKYEALYTLWTHVSLMQNYQADVDPVAPQLTTLASSWAATSLGNPTMDSFAHAISTELEASLTAPPESTCAFVKGAAAHNYSYAWAKSSSYGKQATEWWVTISAAGNAGAVGAFWSYVLPKSPLLVGVPDTAQLSAKQKQLVKQKERSAGQWSQLFTSAQRTKLANLPGELG